MRIPEHKLPDILRKVGERREGGFPEGVRAKRREQRLLGGLPHHRIAADERERRVPPPHRRWKVERRDHAHHAERVPRLHHPMARALGRDGEPVQLPREAYREVADVDHLLHLAQAFAANLAGLDGDDLTQLRFVAPQPLAERAHHLAPPRCRHRPPLQKGLMRPADRVGYRIWRGSDHLARDGGADRKAGAVQQAGVDTERCGERSDPALQAAHRSHGGATAADSP